MRTLTRGVCVCCGHAGAVWETWTAPADLPPLCDRCEHAQRRWEAAERERRSPGSGYPYRDPPPKSPPVRRGAES